jgi:hypothetical protein
MTSCIFSCAKNEDIYIYEWVYYHLEICQFNKIIIYDTSDNFSLSKTNINLDDRIEIFHKPFTGNFSIIQVNYINEFIINYKNNYKWCAIIDIDEFIVLKQHNNINDFLNEHLLQGSLGVNWKFFGNNNKENYKNLPVITRFTKCENKPDKHVKCISVLNDIDYYIDAHHPKLLNGVQKNEKGKIYESSPFQYNSSCDLIQINHYIIKSREEFNKRYQNHHTRSKAQIKDFYNCHNKNDIEDLTALNKLYQNNYHNDLNKIDYQFYIIYYIDLLMNGVINEKLAFEHFNGNGKIENRMCNLNFDFDYYKTHHNDIKNLYNEDLWHHFKEHGLKEQRKFKIKIC